MGALIAMALMDTNDSQQVPAERNTMHMSEVRQIYGYANTCTDYICMCDLDIAIKEGRQQLSTCKIELFYHIL